MKRFAIGTIAALCAAGFPSLASAQFMDDGNKGLDHPDRFYYHMTKDKASKAYRNKEYDQALQLYILAVQQMEKQPAKEFFVYEDLGDTYRQVGRHRSAAWAYLRAIAVIDRFQKEGTTEARIRLIKKTDECVIPELPAEFAVLGWKDAHDDLYVKLMTEKYEAALGKGDQPTALKYHLRLLRHREAYRREIVKSYETLGDLYLRLDKPAEAAWAFQRALTETPKGKTLEEQEIEKRLVEKLTRCGVGPSSKPPAEIAEPEPPMTVAEKKPARKEPPKAPTPKETPKESPKPETPAPVDPAPAPEDPAKEPPKDSPKEQPKDPAPIDPATPPPAASS